MSSVIIHPKFMCPIVINHSGDNRPYANIKIKSLSMSGLLDSGASSSILGCGSEKIVADLALPVQNIAVTLRTADGTVHSSTGAVKVPVTFNNITREIQMLIVPSLSNKLILGIDFWDLFNIRPVICEQVDVEPEISSDLTTEQKSKINEIAKSFLTCDDDIPLTRTNVLEHEIDTGDAKPIRQRYHPVSPYVQAAMDKELERMLRLGVVQSSESPWSSPVVKVPKPSGEIRLCLDARRLNDVTKKKAYPLPYISRILGQLKGTQFLSSIDLKNSFWQVPLKVDSREKTAFTVPGRGHYEFVVMPFGLSNAAQTQSQLMNYVLGFDMEPYVFVYIDDIVIATSTFEEHLFYLKKVAERLAKANLSININKSKFCVPEIHYLGYILNKNGLSPNPGKVSAILNYPSPESVKQVRQLMGMVSWYRRFIKNLAEVTTPITALLKKSNKFIWTDEAELALNKLKIALTTAPVLRTPDFTKQFIIQVDACDYGMGAVICQESELGEQVVEYMSQKFTSAQIKYSTTEKECLALILAIEKFRPYVEGVCFKAITDHASLLWLKNLKDPTGRLARWALRLQVYDFELVHRKGSNNNVPDALSRNIASLDVTQSCDDWYDNLRNNILKNPDEYPAFKCDEDGVYKYVSTSKNGFVWKMVVPTSLRTQVIQDSHNPPTAAHGGMNKTLKRIQLRYFWPSMNKDTKNFVRTCEVCQTTKYPNITLRHEMGKMKDPVKPWEMISVDLIGPLPRSNKGNIFLLVITDIFTKFVLVKPLRKSTAPLVNQFVEESFMLFSVPRVTISDNGSQFISRSYKKMLEDYKVKLWYTASYHAQANPVERSNRVIKTAIRAYIEENHKTWDENINQIACSIRSAIHDSTKQSPYFLNFGQEMVLSGDGHNLDSRLSSFNTQKSDRLEFLEHTRKTVQANLVEAYKNYSKRYNLRSRKIEFKEGDLVLKRNFQLSDAVKGYSAGLGKTFVKCKVLKKVGTNCYRLSNMDGKDIGLFNVKDLNVFYS